MSSDPEKPRADSGPTQEFPVTVLLVDDQAIVGEAVRRLIAGEADIHFHFCQDPTKAIAQANDLGPTVILQDLVMPEIDGLTLVKFFRANQRTREVPLIVLSTKEDPAVKAQAFAIGANDYLVKLPDRLELLARIRYHSRGYIAQLERNEAYRKLAESQRLLAREVSEAARYVQSLLPEPIRTGKVRVDWRFIPSTQLGGDTFGYHWLDDDHFVVFLLDVSGHGVGASLLSVSAMNVLMAQTLPGTDFRNPTQVLEGLSNAFPMEKHNGKFFTIWYGVFCPSRRQLTYAGGGHPPALLLDPPGQTRDSLRQLKSQGAMIGLGAGMPYPADEVALGASAQLLLYSDGVYEIEKTDGVMWSFDEYLAFLKTLPPAEHPIEQLLTHVRKLHGTETLGDDFSMLRVVF